MLPWDDLRLVLAIEEARGLAAAARRLGVNHSTLYRRLGALEEKLGAALFERRAEGYRVTALGRRAVDAARAMAREAEGFEQSLGRSGGLQGQLRLTAPDDMTKHLLLPCVGAFLAVHSGVQVSCAIDNRPFDLGRREADVALRPTRQPPESLIGRRLGSLEMAVYGAAGGRADHRPAWIAWPSDAGPPVYNEALALLAGPHDPRLLIDSFLGQIDALRLGLGRALLPCLVGDRESGLTRLSGPIPQATTEVWLLTQGEVRRRAVVQAFFSFAASRISEVLKRS